MSTTNSSPINHLIKNQPSHKTTPGSFSASKESEPFAAKQTEVIVQEVIEHEVQDPQVTMHVDIRKDVPTIAPDLKKIGVSTQANSSFQSNKSLKLPLEEKKLPVALQAPLTDSLRWLGELTLYIIDQSHGTIKTAHQSIIKNFIRLVKKDLGR